MGTFLEILKNLKYISKAIKMLKALMEYINAFILNKKQAGQEGKLQDAENKLTEANKIEDDVERLKKKAEAASEIEQNISGKH